MADTTSSPLPPRVKDITGKKFGRLTAIRFIKFHPFPSGKRCQVWELKCDCGKITTALARNLRTGHTKSCGCWEAESRSMVHTKHGGSKHREKLYDIWNSMKQRCEEVGYKFYERWGGRGIKVLWTTYEAFRKDMLPTYRKGLQIERRDNNGHYCKENCYWATAAEQARNRRSNVEIEFHGIIMCVTDWAEAFQMKRGTLAHRLEAGWSVESALTTLVRSP